MKKFVSIALASTAVLALSACGSAEDASVEAEAENVEIPAEEAVAEIEEMPVEDTAVAPTTREDTVRAGESAAAAVEAEADDAGAAAEAAAADVQAAIRNAGAAGEARLRQEGNAAIDRTAEAARREVDN